MYFQLLCTLVAAASFLGVQAQSDSSTASAAVPTSTAGISPCVLTCTSQAASSAGCSSFADVQCVCTSGTFQAAALSCLQANCTAEDVAAAVALQGSTCGAVSSSGAASTGTGTSASSGSGSASGSASGTPTAASSSGKASASGTAPAASSTAASSAASTPSSSSKPNGVGVLEVNVITLTGILAGVMAGVGAFL